MKIGYSFWGILAKPELVAGTGTTEFAAVGERHLLVDEFIRQGHTVISLQKRREQKEYPGVVYANDVHGITACDIVYMEWRWPMPGKNTGPNCPDDDLRRQTKILQVCDENAIPVVVFDTDKKMSYCDFESWPCIVAVTEPCLNPEEWKHTLFWATDFDPLFSVNRSPTRNYIYLGNNYERLDQFSKYYGTPSAGLRYSQGVQTIAYGNWIEESADRESPKEIIKSFPFVSFGGRKSYYEGMKAISESVCTTLLAKDEYYKSGFIASRVYEPILCGTPMLIPAEHKHLLSLGQTSQINTLVHSAQDVVDSIDALSKMTTAQRAGIVNEQFEKLRNIADFSPAAKVKQIIAYSKFKKF